MARYETTISSTLRPAEAFAYMADFANAARWDPSVRSAERLGGGPIAAGTAFDLVARFAGRDVPLRYTIVAHEPPERVVLEARRPGYLSRDTISVEPAPQGSTVHYDARLVFNGAGRLLEPLMQRVFNGVGARASAGLRAALNP